MGSDRHSWVIRVNLGQFHGCYVTAVDIKVREGRSYNPRFVVAFHSGALVEVDSFFCFLKRMIVNELCTCLSECYEHEI